MYQAGGVVTSKAMLDAIKRLAVEGQGCCRFKDILCSGASDEPEAEHAAVAISAEDSSLSLTSALNDSQKAAVAATALGRMSLIWGPPGELVAQ